MLKNLLAGVLLVDKNASKYGEIKYLILASIMHEKKTCFKSKVFCKVATKIEKKKLKIVQPHQYIYNPRFLTSRLDCTQDVIASVACVERRCINLRKKVIKSKF